MLAKVPHFKRKITIKRHNINNQIRSAQVRLIDENGESIGVVDTSDALKRANAANLDLVEVSGGGGIPVCKIIDYNKYQYDQKSKLKKNKVKKSDLKEFKLGPNISEGDLRVRIERGREFLKNGDMVKYTVVFKGREAQYPAIGETKLKIVESELSEDGKIESPPKMIGNMMNIVISAKKKG